MKKVIERYGKTYKYVFITCGILGITFPVLSIFNINIGGLSWKTWYILTLVFLAGYQAWFISKLSEYFFIDKENKQE